MSVDLTRMDFHVVRFLESEDVEDMDACEVGQYCLLLFKAWTLAKDATLPDDPVKLAKYARASAVSPNVLKKFPVIDTQWGPRRQNSVQLEVWRAARERSTAGKAAANARWNAGRNADSDAQTNQASKPSKHSNQASQTEPILLPPQEALKKLADKLYGEDD